MDRATANKLYRNHAGTMAYVEVSENGDRKIGTAFHVGSGVFLTARHVVERMTIISIHPTEYLLLPREEADPEPSSEQIKQGFRRYTPVFQEALKLADGPFYHSNQNVDVASFRVESVHPSMPIVKLGTHLDDWVRDRDWILTEAIILGYPRIPMTTAPCLVAARAELNAIVQFYNTKNIHFIVSAIPRGGFSGGLVLLEFGFSLGMVTHGAVHDNAPAETRFFSVTSIEPLYECLAQSKLLPNEQKGLWEEMLYFVSIIDYYRNTEDKAIATLIVFDDGSLSTSAARRLMIKH